MSFPKAAARDAMLSPAGRPCRDGGRHRFPKRPSWAWLQPRAKSILSEASRLGSFFTEPVVRNHRAECEVACLSAAIRNQPTRRAAGNPCRCRGYYYLK